MQHGKSPSGHTHLYAPPLAPGQGPFWTYRPLPRPPSVLLVTSRSSSKRSVWILLEWMKLLNAVETCTFVPNYICSWVFKPQDHFYRSQTKFAKVMFSQVFVCPQGGLCPGGSLSMESLSRGSLSRESLSRGLCLGGGGSVSRGVSVLVQGSLSRGSVSRRVSVRETSCMVTSGQYAPYWNAFLLHISSSSKLPLCF